MPYTATALRSSTVSMSGGKIAAPTPQGPVLDKQDPSVKARTVPLGVSRTSFCTTCPCSLDRDSDESRVLQYAGVAAVIIRCPSSYSGSGWTINTFVPVSLFISSAWLIAFPMGVTCLPWPVSDSRQSFKEYRFISFLTGSSFLFAGGSAVTQW